MSLSDPTKDLCTGAAALCQVLGYGAILPRYLAVYYSKCIESRVIGDGFEIVSRCLQANVATTFRRGGLHFPASRSVPPIETQRSSPYGDAEVTDQIS